MAQSASKGKQVGTSVATKRSPVRKPRVSPARHTAAPPRAARAGAKKPAVRSVPPRARPATARATSAPARSALVPSVAARASVALPVHVVTVDEVYRGEPASSPGSAEFAYRILAEGDSWFTIGGIPSSNLLYELHLPRRGIVVNVAQPGDTLKHIAQIASNLDFKKMLTQRYGYRWHVILLSAGGNDLVDQASRVLLNPGSGSADPRHYVSMLEIERFVAQVQEGYRSIVGMRDAADSANNGVPIVVHGYDFPTPRNSPARFFSARLLGPWLHKAFNEKAIAEAMRVPISDYLLNVLAEAIAVLASGPSALPGFHFVDTRGTLQRAAVGAVGLSGDWLNEIHPSQTGYRKIADRVEAKIVSLLAP